MKTIFTTTFLAVLLAVGAGACAQNHYSNGTFTKKVKGSKNYVTKDFRVDDFTGISTTGSIDVTYTQKPGRPRVEVCTSDNIVEYLDIQVKGNTLHIGFKAKNISLSYSKLEVRVSSKDINSFEVTGSGSIRATNDLKTDRLKATVTGSGDIDTRNIACDRFMAQVTGSGSFSGTGLECSELEASVTGSGDMALANVKAGQVEASVAGSGDCELSGTAKQANYSVAGSGDLTAKNLEVQSVDARVTGSGDITCHAVDFLKIRTTGSGEVGYKGDPQLDVEPKSYYKL